MVDKSQLSATVSQPNSSLVSVTGCWPSMVRAGVGSLGRRTSSLMGGAGRGVNVVLSSLTLFVTVQASHLTVNGQGHK